MDRLLSIVTPCSRPWNLDKVGAGVKEVREALSKKGWSVDWYVGFDHRVEVQGLKDDTFCVRTEGCVNVFWKCDNKADPGWGGPQRNDALAKIIGGWVCFVDDDTVPHANFPNAFLKAVNGYPDAVGFMFEQVHKNGLPRLKPEGKVIEGAVDTGQMVLLRSAVGNVRFDTSYQADFKFLRDVCGQEAIKDRIAWISEVGSIYNAIGDS